MRVEVRLGGGSVVVGHVDVDTPETPEETEADQLVGDDDSSQRAAAVAWNALVRNGVFIVNDKEFTAAECAEWWA